MGKRELEVAIISDVHLGTKCSHAAELSAYLDSIAPRTLILNGDIVDIMQFRSRAFLPGHERVLRQILGFAQDGVPVWYVTGNHDAALRTFSDLSIDRVHLVDEMVWDIGGKKTWIHHGDRFDDQLATPRWMAAVGAWFYDRFVDADCWHDAVRAWFGLPRARQRIAVGSKRLFGQAARHIASFEEVCLREAAQRNVDQIICGHIHMPCHQRQLVAGTDGPREIAYLNSGDWVDNLSALEFDGTEWTVARYHELVAAGAIAPEVSASSRPLSPAISAALDRISGRMPTAVR